ncbi:MAG: hypothetical protein ACOZCO_16915 [Bacteroidota bacterium]
MLTELRFFIWKVVEIGANLTGKCDAMRKEAEEGVVIYFGKSVPVDELYYACNNRLLSEKPVEIIAADFNGSNEKTEIKFDVDNAPRPMDISLKNVRRFRHILLRFSSSSVRNEFKFFWKHGDKGMEPLQFSVL